MDLLSTMNIEGVFACFLIAMFVLFMILAMFKLVSWSKKMPKGAFIFLAIFPLISIFPIPPQEIKKLENIKKEQVKRKEESGDPLSEDADDMLS